MTSLDRVGSRQRTITVMVWLRVRSFAKPMSESFAMVCDLSKRILAGFTSKLITWMHHIQHEIRLFLYKMHSMACAKSDIFLYVSATIQRDSAP